MESWPNPLADQRTLILHHWPLSVQRREMVSRDFFYITTRPENHPRVLSVGRRARVDMAQVLAHLKRTHGWSPTLFIANIDAYFPIIPLNVAALNCPKLLILGDSHHGDAPLRNLIRYVQTESYDAYLTDYLRQHQWFFHLAGLKRLFWLPGLFVRPFENERAVHERRVTELLNDEPAPAAIFVGQARKFHPRRKRLIEELGQRMPGFRHVQTDQQTAQLLYGRVPVSLNFTLNADANLRYFEIAAAGGVQLADRLSAESGMDLLFRDGREIVYFDGIEDLIEACGRLKVDEPARTDIGRGARERFLETCGPQKLLSVLHDIIEGREVEPLYRAEQAHRIRHVKPDTFSEFRLHLYEIIQQLHKERERLEVMWDASAEDIWPEDLIDLPRVKLTVVGETRRSRARLRPFLSNTPDAGRIRWCDKPDKKPFDLVITSSPNELPSNVDRTTGLLYLCPDRSKPDQPTWRLLRAQ